MEFENPLFFGTVNFKVSVRISTRFWRIAQDLGIGSSTLKTWIRDVQKLDPVIADTMDHTALLRENERLHCESLLLRKERELLKKATQFFASQKS